MTYLEQVRQSINELKSCQAEDIGKHISPIITFFKYLSKEEKHESAYAFHLWAEENSAREKIKLPYAQFLLGMYHFTVEEFEPALRLIADARKQFDDLNDHNGKAHCALLTSATYRTFGNIDLALKLSFEAYAHLKQGNNPSALAACANNIAGIEFELHHFDEARSMFLIAYEEGKKVDDWYFMIYSLQGLGKLSMQQNKVEEAKDFFEKALQLAEKNHSQLGISNSLTELANLYYKENDLAKSEGLNRQALDIRERNHLTAGAITSCMKLGEIYIKEARWDEALDIINQGLAMAEQIKVKPKIYQAHLLLSRIYKNKNNLEKSLYHYEIFHEVREQVQEEDNARKLADAKMIIEAEQTKKENIIIKKQKLEIEKKNIELQETIDELTLTKVSRKAKALTLGVAIVMFIFEDPIIGFSLKLLSSDNYWLSLFLKMAIIFSLSPINSAIESYLLKKVIRKKKEHQKVLAVA